MPAFTYFFVILPSSIEGMHLTFVSLLLLAIQDLKSEPDLLVEIITRSATSQMAGMWADSATDHLGGSEWSER